MASQIWNPERECMDRRQMEALQLERLRELVDYCDRNVEFYHKRLSEAGVTADKIKTLSDIQYIPYTTKTDLRDNYPFGLFSVPTKELVRLHASSGTTGNPTVVGYTREDLDNWAEQVGAAGGGRGGERGIDCADLLWLRHVYRRARLALRAGAHRCHRGADLSRQYRKAAEIHAGLRHRYHRSRPRRMRCSLRKAHTNGFPMED